MSSPWPPWRVAILSALPLACAAKLAADDPATVAGGGADAGAADAARFDATAPSGLRGEIDPSFARQPLVSVSSENGGCRGTLIPQAVLGVAADDTLRVANLGDGAQASVSFCGRRFAASGDDLGEAASADFPSSVAGLAGGRTAIEHPRGWCRGRARIRCSSPPDGPRTARRARRMDASSCSPTGTRAHACSPTATT